MNERLRHTPYCKESVPSLLKKTEATTAPPLRPWKAMGALESNSPTAQGSAPPPQLLLWSVGEKNSSPIAIPSPLERVRVRFWGDFLICNLLNDLQNDEIKHSEQNVWTVSCLHERTYHPRRKILRMQQQALRETMLFQDLQKLPQHDAARRGRERPGGKGRNPRTPIHQLHGKPVPCKTPSRQRQGRDCL